MFQAFVTYSVESAVVFWTPDSAAESYVVYGVADGLVRLTIAEPGESVVVVEGGYEAYAVARVVAGLEGEHVLATPVPCVRFDPGSGLSLDDCPLAG